MEICCRKEVRLDTVTKSAHGAHFAERFGASLDRGLAEPIVCFDEVLTYASTMEIALAEVPLRIGATLLSTLPVPENRLRFVCLTTHAFQEHGAEIVLCISIATEAPSLYHRNAFTQSCSTLRPSLYRSPSWHAADPSPASAWCSRRLS